MIRAQIIAAGKMRKGPLLELWQDYNKRITWPLNLYEIDDRSPTKGQQKALDLLNKKSFIIALDENGKDLKSREFSTKLLSLSNQGHRNIQFFIGGAQGLSTDIKDKANFILSFGKLTWPHMLARIMLIEQIYRAQQILSGHPYHKD